MDVKLTPMMTRVQTTVYSSANVFEADDSSSDTPKKVDVFMLSSWSSCCGLLLLWTIIVVDVLYAWLGSEEGGVCYVSFSPRFCQLSFSTITRVSSCDAHGDVPLLFPPVLVPPRIVS